MQQGRRAALEGGGGGDGGAGQPLEGAPRRAAARPGPHAGRRAVGNPRGKRQDPPQPKPPKRNLGGGSGVACGRLEVVPERPRWRAAIEGMRRPFGAGSL